MTGPGQESTRQVLSNAEIADRLASLAQLLSTQKENPYKIRAYQRAAAQVRNLADSIEELVQRDADLTQFAGIGKAIAGAIREIVQTGTLGKLDSLRSSAPAEVASLNEYPRLDPKRVLRIYKKLSISTVNELREKLESGEIETVLGPREAQHDRQGLTDTHAMLLYRADDLCASVKGYLVDRCGVRRAEAAGQWRRRVEVVDELVFVIETDDFPGVAAQLERYGGRTPLLSISKDEALYALSSGVTLRVHVSTPGDWGVQMVACTGSKTHVRKLAGLAGSFQSLKDRGEFPTEAALYERLGLRYIEPELREGHDEIERAQEGRLPVLVTAADLHGDLHAHSTSSDGSDSIEDMAAAARALGYEYLGMTDHSQSLKIARGLSVEELWAQIEQIDKLNRRYRKFQILKSAEVDILADGSLDYPDDLLKELDYTVCSIHSRFSLGKQEQTERILRAMDNRHFNILGHATGRLLLKRPGYEIDMPRVIEHAARNGCFFEINSSPDRLDLSAENARLAAAAGIRIAISTDSHSTGEFRLVRCGIDQARRAGLDRASVLNCAPLEELLRFFRR
jgi:DNA polymerase (family 10)